MNLQKLFLSVVCVSLTITATASAQSRTRSAGLLEADKRQQNPSPQPPHSRSPMSNHPAPAADGIKWTGSASMVNNFDVPILPPFGFATEFGAGGSKAAGQPASGCVSSAFGPSFGGVMSLSVGPTVCSNGQRAICGELGVSGGVGLAGSYGKGICWDPMTGNITPYATAGMGYGAKLPGIGGYIKQVKGSFSVEIPHDFWAGAFGRPGLAKQTPVVPEQLGHDRVRSLIVPAGPNAASPVTPFDPRLADRPSEPMASFRDTPPLPTLQPKVKGEVFGPPPPPKVYDRPIGPLPAPTAPPKPIARK